MLKPMIPYYTLGKYGNTDPVNGDSLVKMLVLNTILTQRLMAHDDFSVSVHIKSIKYLTLSFVHDMHKSGQLSVLLNKM